MIAPRAVEVSPVRLEDESFVGLPTELAARARPAIALESEDYWSGLAQGRLVLKRCQHCLRYVHYPVAGCPWCGNDMTESVEVPATGTLYTFTVCYLEYGPGLVPPYVVAYIAPDVEPDLRIVSNIVNCRISDVRIGMRLRGLFVANPPYLFFEPTSL